MSEYWVSKKRYFCRYCETYIADDAPSRQQHENGLRHKGNVERFIRGIYKGSEKRKKDQDEEKRELARVEIAAQAAYAQDVAAGRAKPAASTPAASTSSTSKQLPVKPSNPYANYTTAASLGYTDPDLARLNAEAERRRTEGIAGEWEVIGTVTRPSPSTLDDDKTDEEETKAELSTSEDLTSTAGVKRPAETSADPEDSRSFRLRKKTWGAGLSEDYDPSLIPIKLKKKEEPPPPESLTATLTMSTFTSSGAPAPTTLPKWVKVQWKKPGEPPADSSSPQASVHDSPKESQPATEPQGALAPIKPEDTGQSTGDTVEPLLTHDKPAPGVKTEYATDPVKQEKSDPTRIKAEDDAAELLSSASSMFRKRKAPVGNGSRPGRRT